MESPVELLLTLSPPVNGLNVVSPTTKAPPTIKGILTSWPGIGVSDLLFLPLFFPLLLDTDFSFVSFVANELLLPPFHLLQLPHLFCDGGHCESQNSHIHGPTLLPITSEWRIAFVTICPWIAVVNISYWLLAAGFLLSSATAMSLSFLPTSAKIVAFILCGITTGCNNGFLCGIADGVTDGWLVEINACFSSSWQCLSSKLNPLRSYSSISFHWSTSKSHHFLKRLRSLHC